MKLIICEFGITFKTGELLADLTSFLANDISSNRALNTLQSITILVFFMFSTPFTAMFFTAS
ncbi:hypothetical protein RI517_06740 [Aeromonas dhakensis]